MAGRPSPTVRRRRLGIELRQLRDAAGLTIEQVAERLEVSDSKISRIETGKVSTTPRDVRDLLEIYKVDGQRRDALMRMAREAKQKGWWHGFGEALDDYFKALIDLETTATSMRQFESMFVPGLLQTPEYARIVIGTMRPDLHAEAIEERVRLRLARQERLTQEDPPRFRVILDEAVLRRSVGGSEVLRSQLGHLIEMAARPRVTLQVLPFAVGAHIGMTGPFTILGFSEQEHPDVVYVEGLTTAQYLEGHEVQFYEKAFDLLGKEALGPEDSISRITEMAKE